MLHNSVLFLNEFGPHGRLLLSRRDMGNLFHHHHTHNTAALSPSFFSSQNFRKILKVIKGNEIAQLFSIKYTESAKYLFIVYFWIANYSKWYWLCGWMMLFCCCRTTVTAMPLYTTWYFRYYYYCLAPMLICLFVFCVLRLHCNYSHC